MIEAALYILTGITLYAGMHQLLTGTRATAPRYPLSLGVMYLLLAGFALTSALTYQAHNFTTLLPAGKLAITLGILLWIALIWFVAFRTAFRPLLLLDVLTAAWIIFLVRNYLSVNSLLYADHTSMTAALPGGGALVQPAISSWWIALELTMLASLSYALYASYRLYQAGSKQAALAMGAGLMVLLLAGISDHLVNSGITHIVYLAPFGFAAFLLVNSLYPRLVAFLNRGAKNDPVVYNLTYNPQQATFHSDVADLKIPLPADRLAAGEDSTPPVPQRPEAGNGDTPARDTTITEPTVPDIPPAQNRAADPAPAPGQTDNPDQETLNTISDNLIDIAVYATMLMNRVKRGNAEPGTLEMLCRKVRTRAIKTRRLANQVSRPGRHRDQ